MKEKSTVGLLVVLLATMGTMSLSGCAGTAPKHSLILEPTQRLVYPVKYLCGTLEPFPTVFHWTDINIINPSSTRTVRVTKKFVASGVLEIPDRMEGDDVKGQHEPVKASKLKQRIGFFDLKPNESVAINCDDILFELGVPPTTPLEGFVEFVSDVRLSVVGIYDKCVPSKHTDVFPFSVLTGDLTIDLGGGSRTIPLELQGPTVVLKGPMHIDREQGTFSVETEIASMDITGTMNVGGQSVEVRLIESPTFQSRGAIVGDVDPVSTKPLFPARSYFDVNFQVHSDNPVFQETFGFLQGSTRLEAAIDNIPPGPPRTVIPDGTDLDRLRRYFPDDELRQDNEGLKLFFSESGDPPINTYCPRTPAPIPIFSARSPATPVASLANHCHGPNPPIPPPRPPKHPKVSCDNASIDVEYIKPIDAQTGQVVESR